MKSTFSFLLQRLAGEEKSDFYLDATRINQDVALFRVIKISELLAHSSNLSNPRCWWKSSHPTTVKLL